VTSAEAWIDRIERRLPAPLRALVERARRDDIMLLAAGLAFYALVSVAPLVILVMWVTSLVLGDQRVQEVARALGRVAPSELGADKALLRVADLGTRVGVVAILAGLWPATSYGAGLSRAFERLDPKRDEEMKGLRGRALALLVLLPVFVLGSLVASYAGSQALGQSTVGRIIGVAVALVAGFVAAGAGIVLIFWIFPPRRLPWRAIARASIVTATGTSVLSLAFTLFISLGTNFEEHYATSGLAGVVLLAVWLFLANLLLLVGYRFAVAR
jgi:membrane protein